MNNHSMLYYILCMQCNVDSIDWWIYFVYLYPHCVNKNDLYQQDMSGYKHGLKGMSAN